MFFLRTRENSWNFQYIGVYCFVVVLDWNGIQHKRCQEIEGKICDLLFLQRTPSTNKEEDFCFKNNIVLSSL